MKLFPRKCTKCGKGMSEGYLFGDEPFCSDACAFNESFTKVKFEKMWADAIRLDEADGDDTWRQDKIEMHYTEWELEDGADVYTESGEDAFEVIIMLAKEVCEAWQSGEDLATNSFEANIDQLGSLVGAKEVK